jgi:hypothetical protein
VPHFWLGRSVARRLLGPRDRRKSRERNCPSKEKTLVACGAFAHEQSGKISTKTEQRNASLNPQAWF